MIYLQKSRANSIYLYFNFISPLSTFLSLAPRTGTTNQYAQAYFFKWSKSLKFSCVKFMDQ